MTIIKKWLADEAATVAVGNALGKQLQPGLVVYLEGQLGAGKTTLTRGILQAFEFSGAVKSPTYTLVEPYDTLSVPLYHFDLYRLGDPEELAFMGIRDYFSEDTICLVEWPKRGEGFLPRADIRLELTPERSGPNIKDSIVGRQLIIIAHTTKGIDALAEGLRE